MLVRHFTEEVQRDIDAHVLRVSDVKASKNKDGVDTVLVKLVSTADDRHMNLRVVNPSYSSNIEKMSDRAYLTSAQVTGGRTVYGTYEFACARVDLSDGPNEFTISEKGGAGA